MWRRSFRPQETARRIEALLGYVGGKMLSDVNGSSAETMWSMGIECGQARTRGFSRGHQSSSAGRIMFCGRGGRVAPGFACARAVAYPGRGCAALLGGLAISRNSKGRADQRRSRRHIARFILFGLYTGTRAGAHLRSCDRPTSGCRWIDLVRGVFYRRAEGEQDEEARAANTVAAGLLGHLGRWKRRGRSFAIEWIGDRVG